MQQEENVQVFVYEEEFKNKANNYRKLVTIEQFKTISNERIRDQYETLNQAEIKNPKIICSIGKEMDRYTDIKTYQHTRLKISQIPDYYLNASHIKSLVDNKNFVIFCQSPVPSFQNFWQAVYLKNIVTIIMLCSFVDPKRGKQAHPYWPSLQQSMVYEKSHLEIITRSQKNIGQNLKQTTISILGPQGEKIINHYHWTGWSDMKAPVGSTLNILEFLINISMEQINQKNQFIIHCSAGIGRTGTLAALIEAIRLKKQLNKISIFGIVENFRKSRYGCIQTFQQYKFLYDYLQRLFK